MTRLISLLLLTTALSACTTTSAPEANPNATTVEVMAPEPVLEAEAKTDMAEDAAMEADAEMNSEDMDVAAEPAPEVTEDTAEPASDVAPTLLYAAQTKWEMMKFVEAVQSAQLESALEGEDALTVFAPTTEAFERAGDAAVTADLLKGHIVAGRLSAADLIARAAKGESTLTTITGDKLTLYVSGDTVKIADAGGRLYTVTQADVEAENGMLHMINGVFAGE